MQLDSSESLHVEKWVMNSILSVYAPDSAVALSYSLNNLLIF